MILVSGYVWATHEKWKLGDLGYFSHGLIQEKSGNPDSNN